MKCGKCGNEIPSEARYCLTCGSPVAGREFETSPQQTRKKSTGIIASIVGVMLVVGILILLMFLRGRGQVLSTEPVPTPQQAPVVAPPGSPTAQQPGLLAPEPPSQIPSVPSSEPRQRVPQEVLAYLEHVRQVESQRRAMRMDLTPAFEMLKKAYGLRYDFEEESQQETKKDLNIGIAEYQHRWQQLLQYFNSVQAPQGCESLATAYGQALGKYSAVMMKIQYAMVTEDISSLYSMQGSAQAEVDTYLQQADHELSSVCSSFGTPKTFSVSPDKGVDALLSPP